LFVDAAYVKGAAVRDDEPPRSCFVHSSGTHGVEGFVGSAIQLRMLQSLSETGLSPPDDGMIVFIHAVNPFGFAWRRRFNEGNCDLNRNWLTPEAFAAGKERGVPKLFEQYIGLIQPDYVPDLSSWSEWVYTQVQAGLAVAQHGMDALKEAVATGHHSLPDAMYFAGVELQESPKLIIQLLQEAGVVVPMEGDAEVSAASASGSTLAPWSPASAGEAGRLWAGLRGPTRLTMVDVHSGLGHRAQSSLLMTGSGGPEEAEAVRDAVGATEHDAAAAPKDMVVQDSADLGAGGVAYKTLGGISEAFSSIPGPGGMPVISPEKRESAGVALTAEEATQAYSGVRPQDRLCIAQEFGTEPTTTVFLALRAESALFRAEPEASPSHPLREALTRVFYPDDDTWRRECVGKGVSVGTAMCKAAFA
jgi:hypothetical protein